MHFIKNIFGMSTRRDPDNPEGRKRRKSSSSSSSSSPNHGQDQQQQQEHRQQDGHPPDGQEPQTPSPSVPTPDKASTHSKERARKKKSKQRVIKKDMSREETMSKEEIKEERRHSKEEVKKDDILKEDRTKDDTALTRTTEAPVKKVTTKTSNPKMPKRPSKITAKNSEDDLTDFENVAAPRRPAVSHSKERVSKSFSKILKKDKVKKTLVETVKVTQEDLSKESVVEESGNQLKCDKKGDDPTQEMTEGTRDDTTELQH